MDICSISIGDRKYCERLSEMSPDAILLELSDILFKDKKADFILSEIRGRLSEHQSLVRKMTADVLAGA